MQGPDDKQRHDTAWKMEISVDAPRREALPAPPFRRRALALAAHPGKLYVIGGMQEQGGPTTRVAIFEPAMTTWSEGPQLVGEQKMTGSGASAFAAGRSLYVLNLNRN